MDTEDPELQDVDWSGAAKAAAVGADDLGSRVEKLSKLWDAKHEGEHGSLDLSPGGSNTPEGELKSAFDKAARKPIEEIPAAATGDDKPHAGQEADKQASPPPEPPTEPWARIQYELNQTRVPATDPLAEKMKAVGWAPPETSKPPDWEALQKGLQSAQDSANATRIGQQSFQAVAPSFHADPNAGSAEIAAAKAPLEVAQERQRFEAQQQANTAKLLAQHKEQTRMDPNSPESERARAALRPVFEMAGNVPDGFEKWSAADVEQHSKLLTPIAGQLTQERIAKGREDASAAEKKAAAELADKRLAETTRHDQATEAQAAAALASKKSKQQKAEALGAPPIHSLDDIKDPSKRATVAALIAPGENHLDSTGMMRTAAGRELMGLALQLDPNYSQQKYGVSKAVSTQMATDKSVDALNTASNHLDELEKAVAKSGNFDTPTFNRIKNTFLNNSGSDAVTALETIGGTAAHEVAGAYGIATESGRHEIEKMFSESQSPAQLLERIHTQRALMGGKGQSMVHRAESYGAQAPAIMPNVLHPEQPNLKTPSGKPYAKKQMNPATKRIRYLDARGNVVEETGG